MTLEDQIEIANSFSETNEEFTLDINLSINEFNLFEKGMFSTEMEDKWNTFVIDNYMYWAHSWTDDCIYKIKVNRHKDFINLEKGFVTRDKKQFNSDDIEGDKILFLTLLQSSLGRDDIYVNPLFGREIVKKILSDYNPIENFIKSIGRGNTVSLTRKIHDDLITYRKDIYNVSGWTDLKFAIKDFDENEELVMLFVQHRETKEAITYYLDNNGEKLLGQIIISER